MRPHFRQLLAERFGCPEFLTTEDCSNEALVKTLGTSLSCSEDEAALQLQQLIETYHHVCRPRQKNAREFDVERYEVQGFVLKGDAFRHDFSKDQPIVVLARDPARAISCACALRQLGYVDVTAGI